MIVIDLNCCNCDIEYLVNFIIEVFLYKNLHLWKVKTIGPVVKEILGAQYLNIINSGILYMVHMPMTP